MKGRHRNGGWVSRPQSNWQVERSRLQSRVGISYGSRQWWRWWQPRDDGARGERVVPDYGRWCGRGTRLDSLDAELRSILYPSKLLHTLHVPINTTIPESSSLSRQSVEAYPSKYRFLILHLIMEIDGINLNSCSS